MYIDKTLYRGRPQEARIPKEERCYDLLDGLGIEYYRVDHEHADTIEACEEVESLLGCKICKNLFLTNRQQTEFYLLLMPGEKPFKTRLLSKQIGSARLSFASPEHMERLLFICPKCGMLHSLQSKGDTVRCWKCGFSFRYLPTGFLQGKDLPYDNLRDWKDDGLR